MNVSNGLLKIPLLFALFHRRFGNAVVHAGGTALGHGGGGGFGHDVGGGGGGAGHGAGAGNVAHGAKTHAAQLRHFAFALGRERRNGHEQAVSFHHFALVGVVNRRQGEVFAFDVLPDVQFRPVGNWNTRMFSPANSRVL